MSREQKIAAVEAYLNCFITKDLSKVSFAEDVTFEGPRMPKLTGRPTILGFLTHILPMVKAVKLKQHIVEGDYVATVFDMERVNGVDHVFDWIHIVDGQIKAIHAFYYPNSYPRTKLASELFSISSVIEIRKCTERPVKGGKQDPCHQFRPRFSSFFPCSPLSNAFPTKTKIESA